MAELYFRNRLREYREKKRMEQKILAMLCHTTRQTISAIENGTYSPTAKLAYVICSVLDVKFEDMFYFSEV